MAEFECRLKKYRQLKDLTQEQLAAQVGVRRETIMWLEKAQYLNETIGRDKLSKYTANIAFAGFTAPKLL